MEQNEVKVGSVWADNDRRAAGRTVRVEAVGDRYASCTVLTARDNDPAGCGGVGRRVVIRIDRMRPTSTGYRLLTDAPEEG